jgi:hypothetical protein
VVKCNRRQCSEGPFFAARLVNSKAVQGTVALAECNRMGLGGVQANGVGVGCRKDKAVVWCLCW